MGNAKTRLRMCILAEKIRKHPDFAGRLQIADESHFVISNNKNQNERSGTEMASQNNKGTGGETICTIC